MKTIDIKIKGMHCEGCSKRLTKILGNMEGVKTAEVSLETTLAHIEYDETCVKVEDFYGAIEDAGFEVIE